MLPAWVYQNTKDFNYKQIGTQLKISSLATAVVQVDSYIGGSRPLPDAWGASYFKVIPAWYTDGYCGQKITLPKITKNTRFRTGSKLVSSSCI